MMLAYRLVRLIENHSDALAAGLLEEGAEFSTAPRRITTCRPKT